MNAVTMKGKSPGRLAAGGGAAADLGELMGRETAPYPVTLAELYALRAGRGAPDPGRHPAGTGQYL